MCLRLLVLLLRVEFCLLWWIVVIDGFMFVGWWIGFVVVYVLLC